MTDIVKRLRDWRGDPDVLMDEAADEIERLRSVAQHETDCAEAYQAHADTLRAAITTMIDSIERWLETGIPAGPDESKAIYEQLSRAVEREPMP